MIPIGQYFSLEARRIAATATYTTRSSGTRAGTYRRTERDCCPVGLLLQADGYGPGYRCPDSALAASAIYQRLAGDRSPAEGTRALQAVRTAVAAFIQAWDAGEIDDLHAALGVAAEDASLTGYAPAGGLAAPEVYTAPPLPALGSVAKTTVARG